MKSEGDLSVNLGGIRMKNPVMVASGTFGYGPEYADLVDLTQLGAIVVKGISPEPTRGNPADSSTPSGSRIRARRGSSMSTFPSFANTTCP